jgi:hypothetical protein
VGQFDEVLADQETGSIERGISMPRGEDLDYT